MTPEEIAIILTRIGYQPLLDVIKITEPDIYRVIEAITMVRGYKYGSITITVTGGNITMVSPTVNIKTR